MSRKSSDLGRILNQIFLCLSVLGLYFIPAIANATPIQNMMIDEFNASLDTNKVIQKLEVGEEYITSFPASSEARVVALEFDTIEHVPLRFSFAAEGGLQYSAQIFDFFLTLYEQSEEIETGEAYLDFDPPFDATLFLIVGGMGQPGQLTLSMTYAEGSPEDMAEKSQLKIGETRTGKLQDYEEQKLTFDVLPGTPPGTVNRFEVSATGDIQLSFEILGPDDESYSRYDFVQEGDGFDDAMVFSDSGTYRVILRSIEGSGKYSIRTSYPMGSPEERASLVGQRKTVSDGQPIKGTVGFGVQDSIEYNATAGLPINLTVRVNNRQLKAGEDGLSVSIKDATPNAYDPERSETWVDAGQFDPFKAGFMVETRRDFAGVGQAQNGTYYFTPENNGTHQIIVSEDNYIKTDYEISLQELPKLAQVGIEEIANGQTTEGVLYPGFTKFLTFKGMPSASEGGRPRILEVKALGTGKIYVNLNEGINPDPIISEEIRVGETYTIDLAQPIEQDSILFRSNEDITFDQEYYDLTISSGDTVSKYEVSLSKP